jgi:hypothetical protein
VFTPSRGTGDDGNDVAGAADGVDRIDRWRLRMTNTVPSLAERRGVTASALLVILLFVVVACAPAEEPEPATVILCQVVSEWAATENVEIPLQPDAGTDRVVELDLDGQLRVRFFWSGGHLGVIAHDTTGERDIWIFSNESIVDLQLLANQATIGEEVWDSGPATHHTNRLHFRVTCQAA